MTEPLIPEPQGSIAMDVQENLSLRRRLLSGGAWALGGRVVTAFTGLASNALLARLLSPQDLGTYFLAFSVVSLGAVLGSLGLNQAVVRFVAESMGANQAERARRTVVMVVGIGAIGATVVALMYLLFGGVLGALFHAPALAAVTGLVAGWIVVMTLQHLLAETFRGFHDIRLATAFSGLVMGVLLTACLSILWLSEGQATLGVVILLAGISGLTSTLLAGWLLHRKVTSLAPSSPGGRVRADKLLRVAWPLMITGVTIFALTQADLWIVGVFRPQEEVAIYGAAVRMVTLVAMPLLIVNAVVPPLIAEMYFQGKKRELQRALRISATLAAIPAIVVLLSFTLFGAPILGAVFGDYYREGATVLALLSVGQLVNVWAGPSGLLLNMTGHHFSAMAITLLSAITALVTAILIVDNAGIAGVGASFAGGLILQNGAMILYTWKVIGILPHASLIMTLRYILKHYRRMVG